MTPDQLAEIEQEIQYLAAGPESVKKAEEALLRVARPLFRANGYTTMVESVRADSGVDLVASRSDHDSVAVVVKCPVHRLGAFQIREVLALAEARRHSQYLLITNSDLRSDAMESAREAASLLVNVLTLDGLRGWVEGVRHRTARPQGAVAALVSQLSRGLIELIARNPKTLFELEWRQVEQVLAEAFEGLGFSVTLTPPSKDGGKDIVLECSELGSRRSYVVEIKHWVSGKAVGKHHLRNFVSVVLNERHSSGLFLSTSGFAGNAFEALSQSEVRRLRVGGKDKMVAVCETHVKAGTGLWAPRSELVELLFDGTSEPEL